MKWFSKCPLLICLIVTSVIMTAVTRYHLQGNLSEYQEKVSRSPALAALFMGMKDGVYICEENIQPTFMPQENTGGEESVESAIIAEEPETDTVGEETPDAGQILNESENSVLQTSVSQNSIGQDSVSQNTPDITYEFTKVEEDYFDDALFIGDSRTQGMFEYGGLEECAEFYCKTSLTVHDLFEKQKEFIRIGEEKLTLEEALGRKQFGKIYLMLGINELGTGTPQTFLNSFSAAVDKIRQLQPGAVIFVQSIMRVAGEKNASDPLFNNTNINRRNELLQTLADDRSVFYIDVNEALCDENGNLHSEWTFDQIHLKAKYYEVWKEVLKEHGIIKQ